MSKYRLYSAIGIICSSVWAASIRDGDWVAIACSVAWLVHGAVYAVIADRADGEQWLGWAMSATSRAKKFSSSDDGGER